MLHLLYITVDRKLTGSRKRSLTLSCTLRPSLGRTRRYTVVTSGQERRSFSSRTAPMNPVPPVIRICRPEKKELMDLRSAGVIF